MREITIITETTKTTYTNISLMEAIVRFSEKRLISEIITINIKPTK